MNRQEFESLSLEEKIAYMNERSHMTLKEIAKTIEGMPSSSLSQLLTRQGYNRLKGIYVKTNDELPQEPHSDLQELLQYKNQLIALALREEQNRTSIDFSVLNQFGEKKKSYGFDIPLELADIIDNFIKCNGYQKQYVFSLAIYEFIERHEQKKHLPTA